MDRRSWPWRRKLSGHIHKASAYKASFDSVSNGDVSPRVSFKVCEEPAGSRLQEITPRFLLENASALEAVALSEQAEEKVKTQTQKLNEAVGDLTSTEAVVKQRSKVAEEAVSGWETPEADAMSLKQELEASVQLRSMVEGRVAHLDGALKECMKQVRHAREEQQQKIVEAIECKTEEWKEMKAELDAREADLRQRLMESDAQNSAMAKSLQERARTITESQEAKARAETEVRLLQVKLESLEKEISALRYELHVLNKELEIRNEEREYSRKAADAAHKQHLENVKKVAKLESECQRLRTLVRKKLPGPAALAQMKMEAEAGLRRGTVLSEQSRRRVSLGDAGRGGNVSSARDHVAPLQHQQQADVRDSAAKDMAERLVAMEEETRILKETLAKRNAELLSARQMCARTANKLSVAEDQLESLQGTPTSVSRNGVLDGFVLQSEGISGSTEKLDDDEVSCAESWASALITELAHFKKDKVELQAASRRQSMDSCGFDAVMEGDLEADQHQSKHSAKVVTTVHNLAANNVEQAYPPQFKHSAEDRRTLKTLASKEAQLQSANLMCKDAIIRLASAEAKLGGKLNSETQSSDVEASMNCLAEAHGIMSKLDRVLDEMRIAVACVGDTTDDDDDNHGITKGCEGQQPKMSVASVAIPLFVSPSDHSRTSSIPVASLSFVLCKLIFLLEVLLNPSGNAATPNSQAQKHVQGLVKAKDSVLHGKGSVMEFFLRFAVVLSGLCNSETSDLESLLSKELLATTTIDEGAIRSSSSAGAGEEQNAGEQDGVNHEALTAIGGPLDHKEQLDQLKEAKTEMEKKLGNTEEELRLSKAELAEAKVLIGAFEARMLGVQREQSTAEEAKRSREAVQARLEKALADEEAKRGEVQAQLEKAETEVSKLQRSVASLTVELADQRKEHEGALAKCEALDQKLQGYVDKEHSNSCRFELEDGRARKEREVAAAKEKLAECQRTIHVLGKQLTALTSPTSHSPAASVDSSTSQSYGPSDQKVEQELDGVRHQQHRRPSHSGKPNDTFVRRHDYSQQAQPAHYSHSNPRRIHSDVPYRGSNGVQYSVAEYLRMDDGSSLCNSPPDSVVGSLSGSPTRDLAGPRRYPNGNPAVRTSLKKSMDRAATTHSRHPNGSSTFSRFFSRTKK